MHLGTTTLMVGVMIRGLVELLDCLDDQSSCCTVLCAWPIDMGFVIVFCSLFGLPSARQGYKEHCIFANVIILSAMYILTCASLRWTCTVLSLVSYSQVPKFRPIKKT